MNDLEKAYKALDGKQALCNALYNYYSGNQPVVYTAQRLREIFNKLNARFTENWCGVVVDAVRERIELTRLAIENESFQAQMAELWETSEMQLESDEVHTAALWAGESFIVAWPDEDGTPQAFYNDPRLCHVFYESDNPRRKRFAAKWWIDDDERRRLTLYYRDRLEYYISNGKADSVQTAASFVPLDEENPVAVNPYGEIPVFHFRTRHVIQSDLKDVTPVQDAINKLLADMMVAAEYGAFPQRYVISNVEVKGQMKNAPNEVWDLPAGMEGEQPTQAGQFGAVDLKQYLDAIAHLVSDVSAITRTPHHYFFNSSQPPSGEALIVMESGLNKKTLDRINRFIPTWRRVGQFMLLLAGTKIDAQDIMPEFEEVATVQPRSDAEIDKMHRETALLDQQLGVSKNTILTQLDYDPEQEATLRGTEGADMADTLLTNFDRGL